MNCKPNDIAVKIKSRPSAYIPVGAIVRVLYSVNPVSVYVGDSRAPTHPGGAYWAVEWRGEAESPHFRLVCPDEHLRPLPGNEAVKAFDAQVHTQPEAQPA